MSTWSPRRPARARRRSPRALATFAAAIRIEHLEERALLSAVLPGLDQHGVIIGNGQAAGQSSLLIDSSYNAQLSNNAQGSGLFINLNNQGGQINALQRLVIRDVTVDNNANAGVQIRLANMTLDTLSINKALITNNGGSGIYLELSNVRIRELIIWDSSNPMDGDVANAGNSSISDNAFDGVHFVGANSNVSILRLLGNQVQRNAGHGVLFDFNNMFIPTISLNDNEILDNTAGSGVHFETNRSNVGVSVGVVVNNTITGNASHGMSFVSQSLLPGSVPTLSPSNIDIGNFSDNTLSGNLGSGVSVDLREQTTWDATLLRNTISGNQQRGFDLKAIDTESAFNVRIGSTAVNPQQQLIDGNTFDANVGAAIAMEINDSTGNLGNTTGRFVILGNTITGSLAAAGSFVYRGEGINISARGDLTRQNGAARFFQSIIDRNIITGNAGDGVRLNITEDSELIDLTIGNATGRQQAFDVNGAFAGGGNVPTVAGDGNLISGNGGNGISLIRLGSAYIKDIRILDNRILDNADGIYVQASNTYVTVPNAARPSLPVVTDVTINRNDVRDNRLNGVHLRTEFDAVLLANLRYNRIDGNLVNGIRVTGLENNIADFENVGGTWVKNAITNNDLNGISIETVVGSVNPLVIGQDGIDVLDGQSLGNYIALNGEDGIEIGARAGAGGTVIPRDIRDAVDIINNDIVNNGRNAIGNPYLAGKGIDIELLASVTLNGSGQTREFRIDRNVIQGNAGDGIEINNQGGQLRLSAQGNFIDLNGGRGVDLLNQSDGPGGNTEAYVRFGGPNTVDRNIVTNNGLEGVYVVNTPSPGQTQDVDAEAAMVTWDISGSRLEAVTTVNLLLDFENNEVRDNGGGVPQYGSPPSSLSSTGLVIRVGSQYSAGSWTTIADLTGYADAFSTAAAAGVGTNGFDSGGSVERDYRTSANGRVNARIVDNEFSGNGGDDVFLEGYAALMPRTTNGSWNATEFARGTTVYDRDPLSRLNVEFHGNTGDSLDVVRTQGNVDGELSSYTNAETNWKSRTGGRTAPDPNGPFGSQDTRNRVVSRVADRGAGGGSLADAYNPDFRLGFSGIGLSAPNNGPNVSSFDNSISIATVDGLTPGGPIVVTVASRSGDISDATNANPSVITSAGHGLFTGDQITISGVGGNTAINGTWIVERVSNDTFRLRDTVTNALVAGNGAYTSGGTWTLLGEHRLSTGDLVTISGTGVPNANGVHMVRVLDAARFELYVPTDVFSLFGFGSTLVPVPGQGFSSSGGTVLEHNPSKFQYDGLGPSTLRIESNWNVSGFSDLEQGDNFNEVWNEGISPTGIGWDGVATGTFSFLTASIADATFNEADGTQTLTVTLSEDAPVGGVTIRYMTSDGSAKADPDNDGSSADGDYAPITFGTVFIAAGSRTGTATFTIRNDTALDQSEQFYIDLFDISTGDFVDSRGVVTITPDADPIPSISIGDIVVDEITGVATFTVSLSNASSEVVSVDYTTVDGLAKDGSDYAGRGGTIAFAPGETTRTVEVVLVQDRIAETDETLRIALSGADNAVIVDNSGTATVRDSRFFSVTDVQVAEGGDAVVTISLNEPLPAGASATVDFAVLNGTATSVDYGFLGSTTLNFTAGGPTSQTITVQTFGDAAIFEGDETFFVNLLSSTGAGIAKASGLVTIVDPFQAESDDVFDHEIGRLDGDGWSANTALDGQGYLLHGEPKTGIPGGWQTATFRLQVDNTIANNSRIVRIDVYDANSDRILAQRVLTRREFDKALEYKDFDLTFLNSAGTALELRVFWYDTSYVKADSVRLTTAPVPALILEAETDLNHQIGRASADAWTANTSLDSAGYMAFGPYTTDVPAGPQSATFRLQVDNVSAGNHPIVTIDVVDASVGRVLAQRVIRRHDFATAGSYQEFVLDFVNTAGRKLEFRVFWHDTSFVQLDSVIVSTHPAPPLINFEAETDLGHFIGRQTADGWSANTVDDAAGWLAFGPSTTAIPGGTHAAVFRFLIDNVTAGDHPIVSIDVFAGGRVLASRTLTRHDFDAAYQYQDFALAFTNSAGEAIQFRTFWHDTSFVQQDLVGIVDVPDPQLLVESEGDRVGHQRGRADGDGWSANTTQDTPGFLVYGPWTPALPTGAYTAEFRLQVDNVTAGNQPIVTIDVVDFVTGQVLAQRVLTRAMFAQANVYQTFSLNFTTHSERVLEFRTFWHGTSYVKQDRVSVLPTGFAAAELEGVFTEIDELLLMS
ncbi:MAG: Calx-beta domain-containing protein [Planctomycetaceae bacterium]